MDAITPKAKHDTVDTHSHVVRPAQMEWKKTRFPGCEVKGLLLDKESGLVTALMKFAPGAVLPDHEHVKIEQTYVLEAQAGRTRKARRRASPSAPASSSGARPAAMAAMSPGRPKAD